MLIIIKYAGIYKYRAVNRTKEPANVFFSFVGKSRIYSVI